MKLKFQLPDDANFMKRKLWTAQEIRTLIERYPTEGPRPIAEDLKRSKDAVSSFARRIGLRTPRKSYRRTTSRKILSAH
jgi:hypothetical protein